MIRRSPTRIELRLEDIQEWEREQKRREVEARNKQTQCTTPSGSTTPHKKDPAHERHERIGFFPQPCLAN
ncbi:hypothetical protein B566_EDAN017438 [Ephemera danica]|nr:hypothetical protein B566_EDAN017438 [Ephemera danica]